MKCAFPENAQHIKKGPGTFLKKQLAPFF